MFKPNFRYTDKIVTNLTFIAESRAIILNSPLIPKWEVSLRRDALLRSAHSSTAIEGNPLSLEEVSALAAGRDIMVRRKDKQEVLNYLEALERIPEFAKRTPFTSEDFLEIHNVVTKDILENPGDEGVFRNRRVFVGNRITGEIIFMPPPTEQVPQLVSNFFEWFNSAEANEIEPVVEAGLTHYEIARIHPFIDGNGRTARIINTLDLSGWLEYFTDGVSVSIKAVKEKVIGLSKDIKLLKEKGQLALTERQMKIVERLIEKGEITNRDVRNMFDISNRAALDEISKLINMKVVKEMGKGRNIRYVLV